MPQLTYTEAIAAVEESLKVHRSDPFYPRINITRLDAQAQDGFRGFGTTGGFEIDAKLIVFPPAKDRGVANLTGSAEPRPPVAGEARWGGSFEVDVPMPGGHLSPVTVAETVTDVVWRLAKSTNFNEADATAFWSELRRRLAVDARDSS